VTWVVSVRSHDNDPQPVATYEVLKNASSPHPDAQDLSSLAANASRAARSSVSAAASHCRKASSAADSRYSTSAALTVEDMVAPGVRCTCAANIRSTSGRMDRVRFTATGIRPNVPPRSGSPETTRQAYPVARMIEDHVNS
jgi:hypothetical protein